MYITFHIKFKNDKNYTERTDELNETIEEAPAKLTVWRSEEVVGSAESIYKLENNSTYSLMTRNSLYSTSLVDRKHSKVRESDFHEKSDFSVCIPKLPKSKILQLFSKNPFICFDWKQND